MASPGPFPIIILDNFEVDDYTPPAPTRTQLRWPRLRFFDTNHKPLISGKLYICEAGATSRTDIEATWQDYDKTIINPNPITLDSEGYASPIFTDLTHKIFVYDSADTLVFSIDNVWSTDLGLLQFENRAWQFWDANGLPLAYGTVYMCRPGAASKTQLKVTYNDAGLTTPNDDPFTLDANGNAPDQYGTGFFKAFIFDALGRAVFTQDNIGDGGTPITPVSTLQVFVTAREVNQQQDGFYHDVGYLGSLVVGGSFTWNKKLDVPVGFNQDTAPCQMVPNGSDLSLFSFGFAGDDIYEPGEQITAIDPSAGQVSSYLWTYDEWSNEPHWDEFTVRDDGVGVALVNDPNAGIKLKRTTDFGLTWSSNYFLDCLQTILGSHYVAGVAGDADSGFPVCVDKATGTFWTAIAYLDVTNQAHFLVASSLDGLTWTTVKIIDAIISTDGNGISLAVSNGNIFLSRNRLNGVRGTVVVDYSLNGGTTWASHTIDDGTTHYNVSKVAANGTTLILYASFSGVGGIGNGFNIFRTTDMSTWTQTLTLTSQNLGATTDFPSIRNFNDNFAAAYCQLQYPQTGITYNGTDAVVHTLDGTGSPVLGFFLSQDDGLTWTFETTPIDAVEWCQQTLDIYEP